MTTKEVTIVWRAGGSSWGPVAHRTITIDSDLDDLALCEAFFEATNLYEGILWDALEPLPENRSHTALSVILDSETLKWVGDLVIIDGRPYEVRSVGWERADEALDLSI